MNQQLKRRILIVVCVILAVILALLLALTIGINVFLNKIPRYDPDQFALSEDEIQQIIQETDPAEELEGLKEVKPEEVTMPSEPAQAIEETDHIFNILLIGQDRRPGQGRQRSDAMILCTVNTEKKTLVMTSFLRDTYITMPDYQGVAYDDNRLNACYVFGGMEMLNDAMEMNFGVVVDHNIEVDFSGFENVVNAFGGVGIYLSAAEAAHMGGGLKEGWNHLNGAQALAYSRIRAIDGDANRTGRQRKVLMALFENVRNLNYDKLDDLVNTVLPMVTTDMTNADILKYMAEFFPILKDLQITTQYIPVDGTYQNVMIRGMSVKLPDLEANREILRQTIGE